MSHPTPTGPSHDATGHEFHTDRNGKDFDPGCSTCLDVEASRAFRHAAGAYRKLLGNAGERSNRPEVWTVQDGYGQSAHAFERPESVMVYAVSMCRTDRPAIVTAPDGTQVLVMRVDGRVALQTVRALADAAFRPTVPPERAEASVQALAGARLFYALYHHPRIYPELIGKDGPLSNLGFMNAYMAAQRAFLDPTDKGSRRVAVEDDNPNWLVSEGPAPGDPVHPDDVRRLIAQGRLEAAAAIRHEAESLADVRDKEAWTVAADLAEGKFVRRSGDAS
jgi:hypothetical protein